MAWSGLVTASFASRNDFESNLASNNEMSVGIQPSSVYASIGSARSDVNSVVRFAKLCFVCRFLNLDEFVLCSCFGQDSELWLPFGSILWPTDDCIFFSIVPRGFYPFNTAKLPSLTQGGFDVKTHHSGINTEISGEFSVVMTTHDLKWYMF